MLKFCLDEGTLMVAKIQQEYDKGFYAWILHNVALLRIRKLSAIDAEHVAED